MSSLRIELKSSGEKLCVFGRSAWSGKMLFGEVRKIPKKMPKMTDFWSFYPPDLGGGELGSRASNWGKCPPFWCHHCYRDIIHTSWHNMAQHYRCTCRLVKVIAISKVKCLWYEMKCRANQVNMMHSQTICNISVCVLNR